MDKNNVNFEFLHIKYGIETNNIDLTDFIINKFYTDKKMYINKNNCNFNSINGDPCPGIIKKVFLNYKINNFVIEEIYGEYLDKNIVIDFDSNHNYNYVFGWINLFNDNMFEKILINIQYNDYFIQKSKLILDKINLNKKINVIHLRLENDGIKHWSKINNMTENEYKTYIEKKYIDLIEKYVSKTDTNIILSNSSHNGVMDYMNKNNIAHQIIEKFFEDREKNAIIELLVSKCCNNIFIGNFNIANLNGSTFSYYVGKYIENNVVKIYVDLDKICNDECVVDKII